MTAIVLGYYDKSNLGDEQYRVCLPPILRRSGCTDPIIFVNPYNIDRLPANTTIVICGGGDIINDWFIGRIRSLIKSYRGPVIALSVGITYPSTISYLDIFSAVVLRHFAYVKSIANAQCIPDIGFTLPTQPAAAILPGSRPQIGVFLAHRANGAADYASIRSILMPYTIAYDVVAYSFNTSGESHEGDDFANSVLCAGGYIRMEATPLPIVTTTTNNDQLNNSINNVLSCIGALHLAICVRYHSHVFSIVQGVPFVSLAVTPKAQFLMSDNHFTSNVANSIGALGAAIEWALEPNNRIELQQKVRAVCAQNKSILTNFIVPGVARNMVQDISQLMARGASPDEVADHALLHITGSTQSKYRYGLLNTLKYTQSPDISGMMNWLHADMRETPTLELSFVQPVASFAGIHRSGWEAAARTLKMFEYIAATTAGSTAAACKVLLCDLYCDATFLWRHDNMATRGIIPFKRPWIGFIHHTPHDTYSPYNTAALFNVLNFQLSLRHCDGLFVLSEYLAEWVRNRLLLARIVVPVMVVKHPTEFTPYLFDMASWLAAPSITQVGSWLRDPYAIYALQVSGPTKQVLIGRGMEAYKHPTTWCLINANNCVCETMPAASPTGCISAAATTPTPPQPTVMLQYMAAYAHHTLHAPPHMRVRAGAPCDCVDATIFEPAWATRLQVVQSSFEKNYKSVTVINNLSNAAYDLLLTRTVVFINLVDCSAANTIVECIVRNTPIIINKLSSVCEYLGMNYPSYYDSIDDVWRFINAPAVAAANIYMASMSKTDLMLDQFATSVIGALMPASSSSAAGGAA